MAAYLGYVQILKGSFAVFSWCMSLKSKMPELTC